MTADVLVCCFDVERPRLISVADEEILPLAIAQEGRLAVMLTANRGDNPSADVNKYDRESGPDGHPKVVAYRVA